MLPCLFSSTQLRMEPLLKAYNAEWSWHSSRSPTQATDLPLHSAPTAHTPRASIWDEQMERFEHDRSLFSGDLSDWPGRSRKRTTGNGEHRSKRKRNRTDTDRAQAGPQARATPLSRGFGERSRGLVSRRAHCGPEREPWRAETVWSASKRSMAEGCTGLGRLPRSRMSPEAKRSAELLSQRLSRCVRGVR